MKIYNSLFISYDSLHNDKALSGYITEFSSFNVFDEDIVENNIVNDKVKENDKIEENSDETRSPEDVNLSVNP